MTELNEVEHEFLRDCLDDRGWYVARDNVRPIIDELVERGILRWNDAMIPHDNGETFNLFGRLVPMITLIGTVKLTDFGKRMLENAA